MSDENSFCVWWMGSDCESRAMSCKTLTEAKKLFSTLKGKSLSPEIGKLERSGGCLAMRRINLETGDIIRA